jgi:hypothetical protein
MNLHKPGFPVRFHIPDAPRQQSAFTEPELRRTSNGSLAQYQPVLKKT